MNCKDIQEELETYLGGELDEPRRSEIKCHLDKCQDCSNAAQQLNRLSKVLQAWQGLEPPPIMYTDLKARMSRKESYPPSRGGGTYGRYSGGHKKN